MMHLHMFDLQNPRFPTMPHLVAFTSPQRPRNSCKHCALPPILSRLSFWKLIPTSLHRLQRKSFEYVACMDLRASWCSSRMISCCRFTVPALKCFASQDTLTLLEIFGTISPRSFRNRTSNSAVDTKMLEHVSLLCIKLRVFCNYPTICVHCFCARHLNTQSYPP